MLCLLITSAVAESSVQIRGSSLLPNTCPVFLSNQDLRLSNSRLNLFLSEHAPTGRKHEQRLLRRTYEISRRRLWRESQSQLKQQKQQEKQQHRIQHAVSGS